MKNMKTRFGCAAALLGAIAVAGCAPHAVDMSLVNDTYQCQYMKDACHEAESFEAKYESASSEERKEMRSILITYRSQCSNAVKLCSDTHKTTNQK